MSEARSSSAISVGVGVGFRSCVRRGMEDVCAPNGGIEPMNRRGRVHNSAQGHLTRCKQRAWTKRGRGVDIETFRAAT